MKGWFGYKPFAPLCADSPRAETPIGAACLWCDDPIGPDEDGFLVPQPIHQECQFRMIVGGANHLLGCCVCCGGDQPPDPTGLSRREAAHVATSLWRQGARP